MSSFDYDQISLGIRDLVRELREEHQMDTIDSGDGSNFVGGMECAIPERHVFMEVAIEDMVWATKNLARIYPEAHVECSWSPEGKALVLLWPDGKPSS